MQFKKNANTRGTKPQQKLVTNEVANKILIAAVISFYGKKPQPEKQKARFDSNIYFCVKVSE